jgi:hypothetical protein
MFIGHPAFCGNTSIAIHSPSFAAAVNGSFPATDIRILSVALGRELMWKTPEKLADESGPP